MAASYRNPLLLWVILCMIPVFSFSQLTKIMGKVTDASSGEPIPFVNIIIKGTTQGTLTDFEGKYALELKTTGDSLRYSMIGYLPVTRKFQKNQFQEFDIRLVPQQVNLPEVTIHYTGNPADRILEKVIANKNKNSLRSFESYQYEAYTKIELDANNITDKLRDRKLFKPFQFVFSYVDTSVINGKSYLPVFLTETMSDVYYRKSPRTRKEIIRASRMSGLENESVSQFMGSLSQEVDVYKNYIDIFEKNFISPISDNGIDYYKYYLVDSAFIGNNWCYHIMFKPKRVQELTFTGNMWIADTSFAVRTIEMQIAQDANINFINDLVISQEYEWTDNLCWILTKDKLSIDFNIINDSKKTLGFFGHKTVSYRNFQFNIPEKEKFMRMPVDIMTEPDAMKKPEEFWAEARHEELSKQEKGIYVMVDSVKNIPIFKTYIDVIYMVTTGYLKWGKVELGPYFKVFSFNDVEGARFRLGGRTANTFSKKIQLESYVAYGTKDTRFKFYGDVMLMLNKNPRRVLEGSYKYDIEQLGASLNAYAPDNILTSIFHRGPNNKLTMVREYKISYEHEWVTGISNKISFIHRENFPLGSTEFIIYPDYNRSNPLFLNSIFTSELLLEMRLAFRERFVMGEFYRYSLGSYYPIIQLTYGYGFPHLFKSDFEYNRFSVNISQWFNFSTIGWSRYSIELGKIWGILPYPLLKLHEGNQTFLFDEYASNLMNYYEFVSDEYITAFYTHHFDGLLFNKIPGVRKLKLREVAYIRCVYGLLSDKNATYSQFPGSLRSFEKKPYWETGVGIENIFKIIRVDAVWRLSHRNDPRNPNTPNFGIFVSLNFSF